MSVRLERDGDVGIVIIDNPPINAGSAAVRAGLLEAVRAIDRDDLLIGGVLIGANGTFIAGSDLREFGKSLDEPELPAVIAAIERCAKPFVAALSGAALGGGYELALGCDYRLAEPGTIVGLPEVTLGMLPGAGGTQRLPRLIGMERALRLICEGTRVTIDEAAASGMVDAVARDLRCDAVAMVRDKAGIKRRLIDARIAPFDRRQFDDMAEAVARKGKRRPAVLAAIASVRAAADCPAADALRAEREAFTRLRLSPDAAALRYLFFSERRASRGPANAEIRNVERVAVVGAGTMGAGIATAIANAGHDVVLIDENPDALGRARAVFDDALERWRRSGRLSADALSRTRSRLTLSTDLPDVSDCDLVIEAIVEDEAAKTALFQAISSIARPDAILASNTSYLDLDRIARAVARPERFIGLHFFNPAHVMRLLEVAVAAHTDDSTQATALALSRRLNKQAVVAANAPGFIGNRLYAAYRRQCEFMLEEGALPEQIDRALEKFGFALGPFATGDLSGLDIAWAMRRQQKGQRDSAERYVAIADRLCEAGRIGKKAGAGYYRYPAGAPRGLPDPDVRTLIEAESAAKGMVRRPFSEEEIVDRAIGSLLIAATQVLAAGTARQPADIDIALVNGYGFPRHLGGPIWWGSRHDRGRIHQAMIAAAGADDQPAPLAEIDLVLDELSRTHA